VVIASLIGIGSVLGRLGMGGLADRFGRRASLAAMYVGMTLMLAWWLVSQQAWQLAFFAVAFGACYGGFVALVPAVTIDYFGPRHAGAIIGALYTSVAPGALLGPPIAGYAFDALESYTWPLVGAVACMALATLAMALAPKVESWRAAPPR
jgi:MFS family permease